MSKGEKRQGDFCNAMLVHNAEIALDLILSTFTEKKSPIKLDFGWLSYTLSVIRFSNLKSVPQIQKDLLSSMCSQYAHRSQKNKKIK